MDFAVNVPIFGHDPTPVLATAVLAEKLGYDGVWMGDHIIQPVEVNSVYPYAKQEQRGLGPMPAYMDVFVGMTAIAMKTSKLRFGTSVLIVPYRNPIVAARLLATVDNFSNGRLDVGIGIGWCEEEFTALGVPFAHRGPRTDEYLRIYQQLWTQEPSAFKGRFYEFEEMSFLPKPTQAGGPPIWVGGNSEAAMRRAVRHGHGWQPINLNFDQLAESQTRLRELCVEYCRDVDDVKICLNRGTLLTEDEREPRSFDPERPYSPFIGGPQGLTEDLLRYQEMGVDQVNFHFVARDDAGRHEVMWRFIDRVRPAIG